MQRRSPRQTTSVPRLTPRGEAKKETNKKKKPKLMLLEVGKIKLSRHSCDTSQKKKQDTVKKGKDTFLESVRLGDENSSGKSREAPETEHGLRDKGSSKHWDEVRSELQEGRGVMLGLEHWQEQRRGCPEQPLQNVKVMLTVLSKRK